MDMRTTDFHFFLKSVSQRFDSIAIFNSEFKCLHIQTSHLNNSVGLMHGLKTLKAFFPWDGTQIVVHNDPLLGCSRSDRIQFLFTSESFHFCIEESFHLPWDFSKKIIKIPPIPIVENSRPNAQLIDALTSQADCPTGLKEFFLATIQKIEAFQLDFKNAVKADPMIVDKDRHKSYLAAAAASVLTTIKSKTYSSTQIEYEFGSQTFLKMKTSTSELGIRVDFQGTTSHPLIQMADSITDSICFFFFADYFQFGDLMNEATYSHFQIAKPTQSFVNSKVITNRIYSDFSGLELLGQALLDSTAERMNAKPYLFPKPHLQIANEASTDSIEFSLPNAKPAGSMGTAFQFDSLLTSRPTPSGSNIPHLAAFAKLGINVIGSNVQFRTAKSKETNDFVSVLQLKCVSESVISILSPCFPTKTKSGKIKSILVKPTISINGKAFDKPFDRISLKPNDSIEIKSGSFDFSP